LLTLIMLLLLLLPQDWGAELFEALKAAGGTAYSNYAVGYNNVKVPEATKRGIPVGNTPGAHAVSFSVSSKPDQSLHCCLCRSSADHAF
jgi:lactate dehydrogenase-like 2-hydroxyacid dehydrogenase